MPRISKRDRIQSSFSNGQEVQLDIVPEQHVGETYRAAGYSRLSRLNSGSDNEETIENQRKSINAYVEMQNDMRFIDHYSDNGFTGSDFMRPGWQELMEAAGNKKINCIVFKDLSRLGRNFLETSEYLEQIFPQMGLRVISILDNYDSNAPARDEDGILIPLKNLMNDMYIKEIKAKGKAVRERKMQDGEYTRAVPPYGYLRIEGKGNTLQIDSEVAWVIQLIYKLRKEEQLSTVAIASRLNQLEIMPPKKYQHIKGLKKTKDDLNNMRWCAVTVRKMLSNKVYCGWVIQGMVEGRGKKAKPVDESRWKIKENAHEAIIPVSDYEIVQSSFTCNPKKSRSNNVKRENLFTGLLYCHNCKKRMISKHTNEKISYACRRQVLENASDCRGITFGMKTLSEVVQKLLIKQISSVLSGKELFSSIAANPDYRKTICTYQRKMKDLNRDKIRNEGKLNNLYEDFSLGILQKSEYLYIKEQYIKKGCQIETDLQCAGEALKCYQDIEKRIKKLITDMDKFLLDPCITKEVLRMFVERIEIGEMYTVYITFSFTNILNTVYEIIEPGREEVLC